VMDPATGKTIARVAEAGSTGVARAVAAGQASFPKWRAVAPRDRAALVQQLAQRIEDNADRLALLDTIDTGNPLSAMKQDLVKGVRTMRDAAGLALQMTGLTFPLPGLHYTQREPWGVVGGGAATGDAIVRHPDVQRISFTGSTPTALRIQASAAASGTLKALSFELGGKNPIVVFPDVDRDEVAAAIVRGMNYTRVQG